MYNEQFTKIRDALQNSLHPFFIMQATISPQTNCL